MDIDAFIFVGQIRVPSFKITPLPSEMFFGNLNSFTLESIITSCPIWLHFLEINQDLICPIKDGLWCFLSWFSIIILLGLSMVGQNTCLFFSVRVITDVKNAQSVLKKSPVIIPLMTIIFL